MANLIRVESADMANRKVIVKVYERSNTVPPGTDRLVVCYGLNFPCDMANVYVHNHEYIVVEQLREGTETIKE